MESQNINTDLNPKGWCSW